MPAVAEQVCVPELRFREFGIDWVLIELGAVCGRITDGTHHSPVTYEEGEYLYITSKNIRNGSMDLSDVSYVSRETHDSIYSRCDVAFGDVLLTKDGASTGNVCLNELNRPFSLLSSVALIRGVSGKAINPFIYFSILSPRGQKEIIASMAGQAITRITLSKLRGYRFWFPGIQEQEKIAGFLTAVDERIGKLKRKKELLEEYKRGMMQKLFSQEVRFKDEQGRHYPDWEELPLGELFDRVKRKNTEGVENVLTISGQHGLVSQLEFFNKSVASADVSHYTLLRKDEFAYNKSYSKGYPMGATKRLTRYSSGVVSPLYVCFKLRGDDVPEFFEQSFESGSLIKGIQRIAQEGARNHGLLNVSVVEFFRDISVPRPSIEEQERIAEFLTGLDETLANLGKRIEKAEEFKRGLLQKMFV